MSVQIPVSSPGAEQVERQLSALDETVEGLEDRQVALQQSTNNARQSVDRFGQDADIAASRIRETGDAAGNAEQDIDAFAQAMISAAREGNQGLVDVAASVDRAGDALQRAEGDAENLEAILGPGGAFAQGAAEADQLADRLRGAFDAGNIGDLSTGDINLSDQLAEELRVAGGNAQAEAQTQGSAIGTGFAVAIGQAAGDVFNQQSLMRATGIDADSLFGDVKELDAIFEGLPRPIQQAGAALRSFGDRLKNVTGIDITEYIDDGIAALSDMATSSQGLTGRLGALFGTLSRAGSVVGIGVAAFTALVTVLTAATAAAANLANQMARSSVELEQVASQTGIARQELAAFAEVLTTQNPEVDVRDIADVFSELQQSITEAQDPTTEQAELFDALGLSAERLADVPLSEAFAIISDRASTLNAESKLLAARLTVGEEGARQLARSFGLTAEELARLQERTSDGVLGTDAQQQLVAVSDSVTATNSQVSRLGEELAATLGPTAARLYGGLVDVIDVLVSAFNDLLQVVIGTVAFWFSGIGDITRATIEFTRKWEALDNFIAGSANRIGNWFEYIAERYGWLIAWFDRQDDLEVISATPGEESVSLQDTEEEQGESDPPTPLIDAIRARRQAIDDANDEFERGLIEYEDLLRRLENAEMQLFESARDQGADATADAAANRVLAIRRQIEALNEEVDELPSSLGISTIQGEGLQRPPSIAELIAPADEFESLQDELAIINEFFSGQERLQRRIRTIENARIRFAREGVELSAIEEAVLDAILSQNRERLEQMEELSAEEQRRLDTLNNIADRLSEDIVGNLFDSLVDSSEDFGEALRDAGISALREIVTSAAADAFRQLLTGEDSTGFFANLGSLGGSNAPGAKGAGDKAKGKAKGTKARVPTPGQAQGLSGMQSAAAGTAGFLAGQGVQKATGSKVAGGLAGGLTAAGTAALLGAGPLGIALLGAGGLLGGFFANGGRPPKGKASVVGERGPELFVPDSSGTIIPNEALQPQLPSMPDNSALIAEVQGLREATEAALNRTAEARISRKDFREAGRETSKLTRSKNPRRLR